MNLFEDNPLKIIVVNPFKQSILRTITIPEKNVKKRGGAADKIHYSKELQLGDLSIFDKDIKEIKDVDEIDTVSDGDVSKLMVYPQDNVATLRDKIYVATGIAPFRQHLVFIDNKKTTFITYTVTVGNDLLTIDLFSVLNTPSTDFILNIPVDRDLASKREEINISMTETNVNLVDQDDVYIVTVMVVDLFTILNPKDLSLREAISIPLQRELIYYGFVIKFFPILPFDGFVQIYDKVGDISAIYPFLQPAFTKIRNRFAKEKLLMDAIYANNEKTKKMVSSITKRNPYYISHIVSALKVSKIEIRNLFDKFELTPEYIFVAIKISINNHIYVIDKKYIPHVELIDYNIDTLFLNSMLIIMSNGVKITLFRDSITVDTKYEEDDGMTFETARERTIKLLKPVINIINSLGLLVIQDGVNISLTSKDLITISSSVLVLWPLPLNSEQFKLFRDYLIEYEDADILNVRNNTVGSYETVLHKGVKCCTSQKMRAILSQVSGTLWNQFDYYTVQEVRNKWNDIARNNIIFEQRASSVVIKMTGFSSYEFYYGSQIALGMMYIFNSSKNRVSDSETVETGKLKRLKRLRETDPELFNLKRYDENAMVYSVKCQSNRQPVIYKAEEIKSLSERVKKRVVKFWNFTEKKPAYYDCPNPKYPNLSFRPQDHPLGYCLPCCKKLESSEKSRQSIVDEICLKKYQISSEELVDIVNQVEREMVHVLSFGKDIPIGRMSYISPLIETDILSTKTTYRLIGVNQYLPNFNDAGLIYSILYLLDTDMPTFVKNITKAINNDIFLNLDEGHTLIFDSIDEFKDILVSLLVENRARPIMKDITIVDWINVICELTYLAYEINVLIFTDFNGNSEVRMLNMSQLCILRGCDVDKFMIIFAHDGGIYPMVDINTVKGGRKRLSETIKESINKSNKKLFDRCDGLLLGMVRDLINDSEKKIYETGITLNSIEEFIKDSKKYKKYCYLRGKRGLVYAVIVDAKIYIPCIYSELLDNKVNFIDEFPRLTDFKRAALYDFIDDYNAYIVKKFKTKKSTGNILIAPSVLLRHKDKYIGFKVRFIYDKYGLTFYHAPESTKGRYNSIDNVIDIPYAIEDVNNAILRETNHEPIHKDVHYFAYRNYIYALFMAEFAYYIRTNNNKVIRDKLTTLLKSAKPKISELRDIIDKKYEIDYRKIVTVIFKNNASKAMEYINNTIFEFDMKLLNFIRDKSEKDRVEEIRKIMGKRCIIVTDKKKLDAANIIAACELDTNAVHCERGKLKIMKDDYEKCIKILAKNIDIPYVYETIYRSIVDVQNQLRFEQRPMEKINIIEYKAVPKVSRQLAQ